MVERIAEMKQSTDKLLSQIKKWQAAWNNLEKAQLEKYSDPALQMFYLNQLSGWPDIFPQHKEDFLVLEKSINENYKDMMRRYESLLQQACQQRDYNLDGEFDSFTVDGLISIKLDKEKNQATINGKKITNLSVSLISEAIVKAYKQIWQRNFEPSAFLNKLSTVYLTICEKKIVSLGEYVSLQDIYQYLKSEDNKYTLDFFTADLSCLIESGIPGDENGNKLAMAPIRDSRKAVYIYDRKNRNGRYLGLLRFEKKTANK
jgi:hypothetical protein